MPDSTTRRALIVTAAARSVPKVLDVDRIARRITPMPNGCWAWDGDLTKRGSGFLYGKSTSATRVVWAVLRGDYLRKFEHLHHKCENRGCVNPDHLERLHVVDHIHHHRTSA